MPDAREELSTLGLDVATGTPRALVTLMQNETAEWAKAVKEPGGARPD